ncbi:hypothetical protein C0J52_09185 [Blattella germanica]|nr:hypothetical protein C0J52_09185 [Blattella germanica]
MVLVWSRTKDTGRRVAEKCSTVDTSKETYQTTANQQLGKDYQYEDYVLLVMNRPACPQI